MVREGNGKYGLRLSCSVYLKARVFIGFVFEDARSFNKSPISSLDGPESSDSESDDSESDDSESEEHW